MIVIEKGIEIPVRAGGLGSVSTGELIGAHAALSKMDVGDSIFIERKTDDHRKFQCRVSNLACEHAKRHGRKYVTRAIKKDGVVVGIRVWRVALAQAAE